MFSCIFCGRELEPPETSQPVLIAPDTFIWPWNYCMYTVEANYKDQNGMCKTIEVKGGCKTMMCYYCISERGKYCNNHLGNMKQPWAQ